MSSLVAVLIKMFSGIIKDLKYILALLPRFWLSNIKLWFHARPLHAAHACVALGDSSHSETPDRVCAGNHRIFAYVERVCVHVVPGPAHAPVSLRNKVLSFNWGVGNTKTNARQGQRHAVFKRQARSSFFRKTRCVYFLNTQQTLIRELMILSFRRSSSPLNTPFSH